MNDNAQTKALTLLSTRLLTSLLFQHIPDSGSAKMADLDAELLALAGGDTSSDEDNTSKTRTKTESPPPSSNSPAGTQQRDSGIKLGVARKKTTKMSRVTKRIPKRAKRPESEEGEA